MENSLPAIANLREEFAAHTAKKNGLRFQPSLEASTNISTLTRDLETKRQLGSLSSAEKTLVAEIDTLWQDISWFNNQASAGKTAVAPDQIYSLKDSKFVDSAKQEPKPELHPISAEVAEEIISGLNKQFEEKVMSKLHRDGESVASGAVGEPGRNLQEYLSHIHDQKPRLPFAGEESHIDLQKLKESA